MGWLTEDQHKPYQILINASTAFRPEVATESFARGVILPMNNEEASEVARIFMVRGLRVRPESSCGNTIAGESSEHKPDARQSDEGESGSVEVFVVLGQAPAAIDPGDGALDDPASWDNLETLGLRGTLDHLDPPGGIVHGPAQLRATVGAIGEDRLQEGKQPAGMAVQNQRGAVAVLYVGRMHHGVEDQAEGVDKQVAFLALDLLARVIARRVDARPPFSALFTLWLSIAPALGEAARPSNSRVMR